MIDVFGWRGSLLMAGGMSLQLIWLAVLYRPLPARAVAQLKQLRSEGGGAYSSALRGRLAVHTFNYLCIFIGCYIVFVMTVKFGYDVGLPRSFVVDMYAFMGMGKIVARLILAPLAGLRGVNRPLLYALCSCVHGIVGLLFFTATNKYSFAVLCVTYGVVYGARYGLMTAVNADLFGVQNLLPIEGVLALAAGTGGLLGPFLAGKYPISFQRGMTSDMTSPAPSELTSPTKNYHFKLIWVNFFKTVVIFR